MSLMGQEQAVAPEVTPVWALEPSAARVDSLDLALRRRLIQSFEYLGNVVPLDDAGEAGLRTLLNKLRAGPVSPWVFCLYSRLVAELAKTTMGDVAAAFSDVVHSTSAPAAAGVVALRDPALAGRWWDHFQLVLDTDRHRPFKPEAPSSEDFSRCAQDITAAFALLQRADPAWHDEMRGLLRMIVLGSPASADPADGFNGASTFFLWGAVLLNARAKRSVMSMIDVLVHESSHVLLFGLAAEGPLMRNSGTERYASPVRPDERPLDGIFHACFVTTRVHLALGRMLASGRLSAEEMKQANERRLHNGDAARSSLDLLERHMEPMEVGARILGTLQDYWATAAPD